MKQLKIKAELRYEIQVGIDYLKIISKIQQKHQRVLIVMPRKIAKLIKPQALKNLNVLIVPDGEAQKDVNNLQKVWDVLAKNNFSRADAIIGLGGGATTDLTGFAAASWLRGINWYAIPTSLAAMVDAAIGGKTGINSAAGKNLIGAFHSPSGVYIDLKFLETLPKRDISAGLAEVIKCGFIADRKLLDLLSSDVLDFQEIIYRAIAVKVKVVNKDFKESKLREILNYGHTLGHAIEKHSKYKLRHGEAVAIGMVFAAELSNIVEDLPREIVEDHRKLLTTFNLPTTYPKSHYAAVVKLMQSDKKVKNNQVRFIGIAKVGKPTWMEKVNSKQIKIAYERIAK